MGKRIDSNIPFDKSILVKVALVLLVLALPLLMQGYTKSLIPMIFIIPGVLWLSWGSWIIYLSRTSRSWLVTQGTIVENTIGEIERPGNPGRTVYSFPVMTYRYFVDGIEYFSHRTVLFPSDLEYPNERIETEHFCEKFPLNSTVEVHYNPRSPKDAIIVTGLLSRSKQHAIIFLIIGAFFLWLGLFMFHISA